MDAQTCAFAAPAPPDVRFRRVLPASGLPPRTAIRSGPLEPVAPARDAGRLAAGSAADVELRILLVSATNDEPSLEAAGGALARIGVPFTTLIATEEELTHGALWTDEGGCRYAGIILTQSELGYQVGPDTWGSAFDDAEWQLLDEYEAACGAREVAWYAYPSESNGLELVSEFQGEDVVPVRTTAAGAERFTYLRTDAPVAIAGVWGYQSRVVDPQTTTALLQTETGEALAVVHRRPDGREVLAMTFDSSQWTRHAMLLEYGVIDWVSGGLFLGARRVYLTPQIDDVMIDTELWEGNGVSWRMGAADVNYIADWQQALQGRLPAGSSFVTQMVFNGYGTDTAVYPDTAPIDAMRARHDEFVWVNHTWDHVNMDPMSSETARDEVADNCALAEDWGLNGFSCGALVTPEISGLQNQATVDGLLEAGVRVVVSDTSRTAEIDPGNPGDNPSFNVGRPNPVRPALYQVPRYPTTIYYNVTTVAEEVSLFNYLNRDYYGRELTYPEIIAEAVETAAYYLLGYDMDPLMFHQTNLRALTGTDQQLHSLYTDWIDAVVADYTAQVTLPVVSLPLETIAERMKERGAYDACGLTARRLSDDAGDRLELRSLGACTVPITGLDAPDAGRVELYGGVPTTFVTMEACSTATIPLEAP